MATASKSKKVPPKKVSKSKPKKLNVPHPRIPIETKPIGETIPPPTQPTPATHKEPSSVQCGPTQYATVPSTMQRFATINISRPLTPFGGNFCHLNLPKQRVRQSTIVVPEPVEHIQANIVKEPINDMIIVDSKSPVEDVMIESSEEQEATIHVGPLVQDKNPRSFSWSIPDDMPYRIGKSVSAALDIVAETRTLSSEEESKLEQVCSVFLLYMATRPATVKKFIGKTSTEFLADWICIATEPTIENLAFYALQKGRIFGIELLVDSITAFKVVGYHGPVIVSYPDGKLEVCARVNAQQYDAFRDMTQGARFYFLRKAKRIRG